ncbi:hypothetical protein LSH36_758g01053 [Paralvinella palmiformis]|uniref:Uncharacterized protein n=1 Tax=Paralvinella palmiformis TaxID=53620 RepID=A0AAD9J2F8_9ANNE|nr:hypothetical protein LSH36_758g01053 [Paralvinella palmiformis]
MDEINTVKLEKIFANYISIVNQMSAHYEEQFLGETQIVQDIKCATVGDFVQLLNNKDVDIVPRTSYFQAYAKVGKLSHTFNEVYQLLDSMPPLHYEEDHHRLIQSMLNLALKIGNFISE